MDFTCLQNYSLQKHYRDGRMLVYKFLKLLLFQSTLTRKFEKTLQILTVFVTVL